MADTEEEAEEWISVLNNSKKFALEAVFNEGSSPSEVANRGLQDLTQSIVKEVKRLPGNNICCDCTAAGGKMSCNGDPVFSAGDPVFSAGTL